MVKYYGNQKNRKQERTENEYGEKDIVFGDSEVTCYF